MRDASKGGDDPIGPQKAETEGKAKDGEEAGNGNGGRSVSEQAADGAAPEVPPPPPLEGDKQLSLGGLAKRGAAVENRVSLMSASTEADGLFDPDTEGQLIVSYEPAGYGYVPVRKDGKVTRWKLVQQLRVKSVQKIGPELQQAIEAVNAEHELEPSPA